MADTAVAPRKAARTRAFLRGYSTADAVAHVVTMLFAATVLAVTVLIIYELYRNSALPREKFGWGFLVGRRWDPNAEEFGALPFIYGTVVTSFLALLIAVPLG